MTSSSAVPARLAAVRETMHAEFTREHADPWIVAYSGGKDSTLLLQLAWEIAAAVPTDAPRRPIYVVSNDTLVESPLVIRHLRRSLEVIREAVRDTGLPVTIKVTEPCIDQTFWVNVIGRGYIPPTRNFRWCTDRMKIAPTNDLIHKLVLAHERAILLVGTRKSESQNRGRAMTERGVTATTMNPHSTIPNCRMFAPLADLRDDDVWKILMQRKPPWGGSHRDLITLYRNAGGGECPLVLSKEDAPSCGTTSPRFGCWTCTVVQKDRSMRGLIDAGHEEEDMLSSSFSLDFDMYYLCLMAGLAESRLANTATAETTELVDNFPGEYRTKGRLIVALFLARELRRMSIKYSERTNVHKEIDELVEPISPSHLSDAGLRQINKYAYGGYEVLTEWFAERPRRLETFLLEYKSKLDEALSSR